MSFALDWIAASSGVQKKLSKQEINLINVEEVCDRLLRRLSIRWNSESDNLVLFRPEERKLSFRDVARLCYGTVHIYQQQVDNLLEETRKLVSRSSFQLANVMKDLKRKSK